MLIQTGVDAGSDGSFENESDNGILFLSKLVTNLSKDTLEYKDYRPQQGKIVIGPSEARH